MRFYKSHLQKNTMSDLNLIGSANYFTPNIMKLLTILN